jgi:hypothetical protein
MSNNNIFNDSYRKNFIKNADYKSLNDYLKNMDKLSKKGGRYVDMYNKDLEFILTLNDTQYQNGGNIFNLFTVTKSDGSKRILSEQQPVCDTEGYVNRITNITKNSYCSLVTQQTNNCDNTCVNRFNELDIIKKVLDDNISCKTNTFDWVKAVHKFIDIVLCCGDLFSKDEYEPFRTIYFKELSKIITHNENFLKESFGYLTKILQNERGKLSDEFMKKYSDLRLKKQTLTKIQYKSDKDKLIKEYIVKLGPNGFQTIYSSKMVEKIVNAYKNLMTPK